MNGELFYQQQLHRELELDTTLSMREDLVEIVSGFVPNFENNSVH